MLFWLTSQCTKKLFEKLAEDFLFNSAVDHPALLPFASKKSIHSITMQNEQTGLLSPRALLKSSNKKDPSELSFVVASSLFEEFKLCLKQCLLISGVFIIYCSEYSISIHHESYVYHHPSICSANDLRAW